MDWAKPLRAGYVFFSSHQLREAEEMFTESLAVFKSMDCSLGMTDCRKNIGNIFMVQGKYAEALEKITAIQAVALMIEALVGMAALMARKGLLVRALQTAGFVLNQPSMSICTQKWIERLRNELRPQFSAQDYKRLLDMGASSGLNDFLAFLQPDS